MKKFIQISLCCLLAVFAFSSCDKEETGLTKVTYYASLSLKGDTYMYASLGQPFEDPGVNCELKGEDYSDNVVVKSTVDTSKPGLYTINYTATNEDGFSVSALRYVFVKDPADKFAGIYTLDPSSHRNYGGAIKGFAGQYTFLVLPSLTPGIYEFEDLLGGWYWYGAGYGQDYAMYSEVAIDEEGNMNLISSIVPGWGDEADYLEDGKYDESTKTLSYKVGYAGVMYFQITLNQK